VTLAEPAAHGTEPGTAEPPVPAPRRKALLSDEDLAFASYKLRRTFAGRRRDYLTLVVLVGLVGGIAMGSIVAARRTQSAYPSFLASTNASNLTLSTYGSGGNQAATLYSPRLAAAIARLPGVKKVESWVGVFAVPLEPNGAPNLALADSDLNFAASNGLYFDMDRVTALRGRIPDPNDVDEFMTTALGARLMGVRLGEVVPVGLYIAQQADLPGFGTARVPPWRRFEMKLTGIVQFNNEVVEDDTDRLPTNVVYTPAFTRLVPDKSTNGTWYGVQLDRGDRNIASAEQALLRALPPGAVGNFNLTTITEAKVERALKPESIALALFGLIAALAALGIALPVISRQLRATEDERQVSRALGASPLANFIDAFAGPAIAVVAGSVVAGVVAVALSPLSPLGPVRAVWHPAVLAFDWTVLGAGLGVLAGGLGAATAVMAWRATPRRPVAGTSVPPSKLVRHAAALGLPLPAVVGLHLALEPGRGRTAVPSRSVLAGAVIAVMTVTATLTFSSSLHTLVTQPKLYGWNWDYALSSENGVPPKALKTLSSEPGVAAWSGYQDPNLQLDGETVPALVTAGAPAVGPPVLSGHGLRGPAQVVLGAATLALLDKKVGERVFISYGSPNTAPLYLPPTPATIVGTATFPAIQGSSTFAEHTSMGTGALVSEADLPESFLRFTQAPDPNQDGPALVFVRRRPGVSAAKGRAELQQVIALADKIFAHDPQTLGDNVIALPVQRPAEIVNYQSTGATPVVLAIGLATGAVLALALALAATVRRRRQDFALLKTLGFTGRQLATTLAWQASITALTGLVVGVPIGVAGGRQLWDLFARSIQAVPHPTIPASMLFVALGALALANIVAAVPGRAASSTPAAVVLREE